MEEKIEDQQKTIDAYRAEMESELENNENISTEHLGEYKSLRAMAKKKSAKAQQILNQKKKAQGKAESKVLPKEIKRSSRFNTNLSQC